MDTRRAARAVAARRGQLDMTQQQLADAAGIDIKTIGNLERRGRWPIARTRARIERALGWPPGEMQRIAESRPEPAPVIPDSLMATIRRSLPPDKQEIAVAALERALAPTPPGEETAPERARRAG